MFILRSNDFLADSPVECVIFPVYLASKKSALQTTVNMVNILGPLADMCCCVGNTLERIMANSTKIT